MVIAAADNGAQGDAQTRSALTACWMAISCTETYRVAKAKTGAIAGHWLYIVYRTADGGCVSRPAYAGPSVTAGGLISMDDLHAFARKVVAGDLQSPASTVGSELRTGGGARLAAGLGAG